MLVELIKVGYIFEGWTLYGNAYDFNISVTKDITLVAKWSVSPSAITLTEYNSSKGVELESNGIVQTIYVFAGVDGGIAELAFRDGRLVLKNHVGLK